MKKIVLAVLAIALTLPVVYAQEKANTELSKEPRMSRHHPGKHGQRVQGGYDKLNLTQEQKTEMDKINKDYRSSVTELKKKESAITAKDYRTQLQALNEKRRAAADKVLTKEQKDQLQQKRGGRQGKVSAEEQSQRMKSALGLTDDQSARVDKLKADTHSKIKDIRSNNASTDEQKKEQMAAVFKLQQEEMKRILTPEQFKKMEDMKKAHNGRMSQ